MITRNCVLAERGGDGPNAGRDSRGRSAARARRARLRRAAAEKRVELAPLRRRIARREKAVKRLEQEIARLDAALAGRAFRPRSGASGGRSPRRAPTRSARSRRAEEDWLEASAAFEFAMS